MYFTSDGSSLELLWISVIVDRYLEWIWMEEKVERGSFWGKMNEDEYWKR